MSVESSLTTAPESNPCRESAACIIDTSGKQPPEQPDELTELFGAPLACLAALSCRLAPWFSAQLEGLFRSRTRIARQAQRKVDSCAFGNASHSEKHPGQTLGEGHVGYCRTRFIASRQSAGVAWPKAQCSMITKRRRILGEASFFIDASSERSFSRDFTRLGVPCLPRCVVLKE